MSASQTSTILLGTTDANGMPTGVTTGTSQAINRGDYGILALVFESVGTTSGGTLKIEEAVCRKGKIYTGTWSQIGADISASDFTGTAQKVVHITNSAYPRLRVRITSDITGGGNVIVTMLSQGAAV